MRRLLLLPLLAIAACSASEPGSPQQPPAAVTPQTPVRLMTWGDLLGREPVSPTQAIQWGDGATDIADLWLPDGAGPHPVVLMVHGGCWQKEIADRTLMNWAAEDLRKRGLAVWNIEYRGVDEEGGGYPGTFEDVARAADALRGQADAYNLDLKRVAAFGHSAGGHLALWLAARSRLSERSPLRMDDPLKLAGVVNSGGLADLAASRSVTQRSCLDDIFELLVGQCHSIFINRADHCFVVFNFEHLVSSPHPRQLEGFTLFDACYDVHLLPSEFELGFIFGQIFLHALLKCKF